MPSGSTALWSSFGTKAASIAPCRTASSSVNREVMEKLIEVLTSLGTALGSSKLHWCRQFGLLDTKTTYSIVPMLRSA
jgi:hypothetical protein